MSYCSDVAIVMKGNRWNAFLDTIVADINKWIEDETIYFDITKFLNKVVVKIKDNGYVLLKWNSFNHWEIDATNEIIDAFWKFLQEDKSPFRYCRVGEGAGDQQDVEMHTMYDDDNETDIIRIEKIFAIIEI